MGGAAGPGGTRPPAAAADQARRRTYVEPTGNLDEGTRDEIMALLERLWSDLGLTLVIVTHDSSVARRARNVGQMRNGKLTVRARHAMD